MDAFIIYEFQLLKKGIEGNFVRKQFVTAVIKE